MKNQLLFVSALLLLASCGSSPLTQTECQTVAVMEVDFMVSKAGGDPELRTHLMQMAQDRVGQCVAGKNYQRADFKCMTAATTDDDRMKCMSAVSERINQ